MKTEKKKTEKALASARSLACSLMTQTQTTNTFSTGFLSSLPFAVQCGVVVEQPR
jgi:hypothetical protein